MPASLFQPLVAEDFAATVERLVLTRWIASGLVVGLALVCALLIGIPLPLAALLSLGGALAGYNCVVAALSAVLRRRATLPPAAQVAWLRRLVIAQIAVDWVAMAAFLHFTGGITSPAIPLFLIHMLIVTVLVPRPSPYLYVAFATGALMLVALLERRGTLVHHHVLKALPEQLYRDPQFATAQITFLGLAAFASVHLTLLVVARLRERDRQVAALLKASQATGSSLELEEVLDQLVASVASALSTKAAAIRLLDKTGERMEMIASRGLSERYLNKGFVFMPRSQIDREALAGTPVFVSDAAHDPRIQHPCEVAEEKIASLLVVPIIGRGGPLGVLQAYSDRPNAFDPGDLAFTRSIASQGAMAIENALAHEALQRAENARAEFVRVVTHELRSPVAGALTLVRVILDGVADDLPPEAGAMLGRVAARLTHLTELVNDLLALAASRSLETQEKPVLVDLISSVRRVVDVLSADATAKVVSLVLEVPEAPVIVRATDKGLDRVFGNLVGNGIKYTAGGGRVAVSVDVQASSVVVSVADTGMGIPETELPKLWQEFFRASNARRSEIIGTGLGLALVKRLVTTFGGVVGVKSQVGKGTTFTVTLPLADAGREPGRAAF